MSVKKVCPCALVLTLVCLGVARAQYPTTPPPAASAAAAEGPAAVTVEPPGQLSRWITYTCPDCCGPIGGNGPILTELFLRSGASVPVGGEIFGHALAVGWDIEGGGRVLFFNQPADAAWTVDLSITNILNQNEMQERPIILRDIIVPLPVQNPLSQSSTTRVPRVPVTIETLNRTFANVGLGREWYLSGSLHGDGLRWRAGFDVGGRWGTAKLELNEIRHRTDTIYGAYVAAHTDLECPCGCCTFYTGLRLEYDYTWMNILQDQNDADLQDLNFLATIGVRF